MVKIFIVGIASYMDEQYLAKLFGDFGDVMSVKIITDQQTNRNKGYAFIMMADEVGAKLAIKLLDNTDLDGRIISVRVANKRQ